MAQRESGGAMCNTGYGFESRFFHVVTKISFQQINGRNCFRSSVR